MTRQRDVVIAPVTELRARLSHRFEETVAQHQEKHGASSDGSERFTCGLTGGSAALIFLGGLRDANVDWSRITLFWGDERSVPPDDPLSNYGLADQMLLRPLAGSAPHSIRMPAEIADLNVAARQYAQQLPSALDLLILGVGDDGHVCSLFPGHRALQVANTTVTVVDDAPKPPARRLTLTLNYLLKTHNVWVVAVGERKRLLLQRAVSAEAESLPIDLVISQGRGVTIFTDQQIYRR